MSRYIFFTKTDTEDVKQHTINAESAKKAFEMLIESGYKADQISIAGFKEGAI